MRNPNIHEHPTSQLYNFGFTMVIRFGELNWSSSPFWVPGQKKWRAHGPQDSRLSQLWYSPFPRKPPMSHGQNTVFSNRLLLTISGQSPRQPGMVINPLVGNLYIHSEDFPIWDTHISCFAAHVVSTFPIMAGTQSDVATLIKIIQHDGLIRSPMWETPCGCRGSRSKGPCKEF